MRPWFTIETIDEDTHAISEYRHWEETHSYLLEGDERALLIDTGLGIRDISAEVGRLTDKPVTAVATHVHWDHIGGHRHYPDFYAHEDEPGWLSGGFPSTWGPSAGWSWTAATCRRATTSAPTSSSRGRRRACCMTVTSSTSADA